MGLVMGQGGLITLTADGAVGPSGSPIRLFVMHIISDGVGGGVAQLRNGIADTDTLIIQQTGTTSTGATFTYGEAGFLFPAGLFFDEGANITSVSFTIQVEA